MKEILGYWNRFLQVPGSVVGFPRSPICFGVSLSTVAAGNDLAEAVQPDVAAGDRHSDAFAQRLRNRPACSSMCEEGAAFASPAERGDREPDQIVVVRECQAAALQGAALAVILEPAHLVLNGHGLLPGAGQEQLLVGRRQPEWS
jgi:hypothetical protein